MSKVKKNIRLCAISTDFSELGGYTAQFTDQEGELVEIEYKNIPWEYV